MMAAEKSWLRGDWMETYTGRRFFPLAPRAEDVAIEDIAHALSLQCRYAGHCRWHYSVAQHAVLVSWFVPPEDALPALLHDAAEAYLCDLPRPLKQGMPEYRAAELQVEKAIAARFGLRLPWPLSVRAADNRILLDEKRALFPDTPNLWAADSFQPLGVTIEDWSPAAAELAFLARFTEFGGDSR